MNGLLFLTSEDFYLQKGVNGNIMCTNVNGFSLILFYSTMCSHCQNLIPIFKQLPGKVGGCQFGMINVSNNKDCIMMSQQSINPLTVVPYIILYIEGKPYMRYNGPYDVNELKKFIFEISNDIRNKQKSTNSELSELTVARGDKLQHYRPISNDDVCYLEINEAYHIS